MGTFRLKGHWSSKTVWLNGVRLDPAKSQKIRNHSPDGFAWGYGGSGPAQLALAVCLEIFPDEYAKRAYQKFKAHVIVPLPQDDFEVDVPEDIIHNTTGVND